MMLWVYDVSQSVRILYNCNTRRRHKSSLFCCMKLCTLVNSRTTHHSVLELSAPLIYTRSYGHVSTLIVFKDINVQIKNIPDEQIIWDFQKHITTQQG